MRVLDGLKRASMARRRFLRAPSERRIDKELEAELAAEREIVAEFKEIWNEAKAQKQELINSAKQLNLEEQTFRKLWTDIQALERDAAVLKGHAMKWKQYEVMISESAKGTALEKHDALFGSKQARGLQQELMSLRAMINRDEEQLKADLAQAEKDMDAALQIQKALRSRSNARTKLGRSIQRLLVDANKRLNYVRKVCGKAEKKLAMAR